MKKKVKISVFLGIVISIYIICWVMTITSFARNQKKFKTSIIEDKIEETVTLEIDLIDEYIKTRDNIVTELSHNLFLDKNIEKYLENNLDRLGFDAIVYNGAETYSIGNTDTINYNEDTLYFIDGVLYISYKYQNEDGYSLYASEKFKTNLLFNSFYNQQSVTLICDSSFSNVFMSKDINLGKMKIKHFNNLLNLKSNKNCNYFTYTDLLNYDNLLITVVAPKDAFVGIVYGKILSETYFIVFLMINVLVLGVFITAGLVLRKNNDTVNKRVLFLDELMDNLGNAYIACDIEKRKKFYCSKNLDSLVGITKKDLDQGKTLVSTDGIDLSPVVYQMIDKNILGLKDEFEIFNPITEKNNIFRLYTFNVNYKESKFFVIRFEDINEEIIRRRQALDDFGKLEDAYNYSQAFMTKLSHEFRTPLNGIAGTYDIIKDKLENNDIESVLEPFKIMGEKISEFTDIVVSNLNVEKYQKAILNTKDDVSTLDKIIEDLKESLKVELKSKKIAVFFNYTPCKYKVRLDESKINLLLSKVVSQAINNSKNNGKVTINIEYKVIDNKLQLCFKVIDYGYSMSFEDMYKLNTDEMSDNTEKLLANKIFNVYLKEFNGNLRFYRNTYDGTVAKLCLVFNIYEENVRNVTKPLFIRSNLDFEKLNVLIAEDNPINWMVIQQHLTKKGCSTFRVENGQLAYETFIKSQINEFDLILMDIQMPVLNGYEATEKIRSSNRIDNDILIIAVSADAFDEDVNKALAHGMNAHVAKPVVPQLLYDTIEYHVYLKEQAKIEEEKKA